MDVNIRRAVVEDAGQIACFMSDPSVFGGLLQLPHPSEAMWRERLSGPPTGANMSLVAVVDGAVVGSAGLHEVSHHVRRKHVMSMGISVAVEMHGKGVGTALMAALMDYADNWANVVRVELDVFTDNQRAIELYQRFGFETEGRLRGFALRAGRFDDVFFMARLHPNPPSVAAID